MKNELIFPAKKHPLEKLCCAESVKHPAKADFWMMEWIISNLTEPGDTILDPMAGVGRTGTAAVANGRNCVMVELEQNFVAWINENMKNVMLAPSFAKKGEYNIIQGDSRNLTQLLPGNDAPDMIISSPPYAETLNEKKNTKSNIRREERLKMAGHDPKEFMGGNARVCSVKDGMRYSNNPDNIGNLKEGDIDVIISSPPYATTGVGDWKTPRDEFQKWVVEQLADKGYIEWQGKKYSEEQWRALNHGRLDGRTTKGVHKQPTAGYSKNQQNIGNLKEGDIDVIITSPPYGKALKGGGIAIHGYKTDRGMASRCYSQNAIDAIVSSPPYESVFSAKRRGKKQIEEGAQILEDKKLNTSYIGNQSEVNIGNLAKETYYDAMRTVYSQCYDVLKPGGKIIIIVKDYIRQFKRVPLGENTKKLLEQVGFEYQTSYWRKINRFSFWILNYRKKYPFADRVNYEEIIVCKKGEVNGH